MSAHLRALLDEMRVQALARLERTRTALDQLAHDREGSNDDDEHDPEGVTLSWEWSRLTGLVEAAASDLAQIEQAIARADAGDYGRCAACGRAIPAARLEIRPFATHCVDCAEKLGL